MLPRRSILGGFLAFLASLPFVRKAQAINSICPILVKDREEWRNNLMVSASQDCGPIQIDQIPVITKSHSFEREIYFDADSRAIIKTVGTTVFWDAPKNCSHAEFEKIIKHSFTGIQSELIDGKVRILTADINGKNQEMKGPPTFGHIPGFVPMGCLVKLDVSGTIITWTTIHREKRYVAASFVPGRVLRLGGFTTHSGWQVATTNVS